MLVDKDTMTFLSLKTLQEKYLLGLIFIHAFRKETEELEFSKDN
jgi:hypothetical protein